MEFEEDPRYKIAKRELVIAVGYWIVFTAVVTGTAWLLGGNREADELTFVLGFPEWFFWSVLIGSVGLSIIPFFLVKHWFTDVPLNVEGAEGLDERARALPGNARTTGSASEESNPTMDTEGRD